MPQVSHSGPPGRGEAACLSLFQRRDAVREAPGRDEPEPKDENQEQDEYHRAQGQGDIFPRPFADAD